MIYLDNAATTLKKPEIVYEKVNDVMRNYGANPGRSGHKLALAASREIYHTRELLAEFFHISDPLRIIFTSNATDSLNLAIKGSLKKGDHVITTTMEHNSVLRPLATLEDNGVEVSVLQSKKNGLIEVVDIEKAIKANTKMVIMTHASNLVGTLMPIEEVGTLCRKMGLLFLVDAAQTAGVYPIDVKKMKIDLLAAPGHKSLFGIQGVGILYIGPRAEVNHQKEGGTGSFSEDRRQPLILPDRYESGTLNLPGIAALGAGIQFIQEETMDKIREHEEAMAKKMLESFLNMPKLTVYGIHDVKLQAPVITINIREEDSSEVAFYLDYYHDICVRPGLHCAPLAHKTIGTCEDGAIRFSIGYFNQKEEIEKSVQAITELINGR